MDSLVIGGKEIHDFQLDLAHAHIADPSGRLGGRGKRIEVSGKSQSLPALEKMLVIEVYDDLPTLALTGTSYKNLGSENSPKNCRDRNTSSRPATSTPTHIFS